MTLEEIKVTPVNTFKRIIKNLTKENALKYLLKMKEGKTKGKECEYVELKLQNYLTPNDIEMDTDDAKYIFKTRSKMLHVKENKLNGKSEDMKCTACENEIETQKHILECREIVGKN